MKKGNNAKGLNKKITKKIFVVQPRKLSLFPV